MKLVYFKSEPTNFGDELNAYMWPRLLPEGFLDEDEKELFVGIGSILGEMFPPASIKHVMGSGMAGYFPPPDITSGTWNIVFVRGPDTAAKLGLDPEKSIADSAILLREIADIPAPAQNIGPAYMPHYKSLPRGNWKRVCELAGLRLIDPTDPPEKILAEIRGASVMITEAMHGAIVADALRTPWIAIQPLHGSHRAKWADWASALQMQVNSVKILPSSVRELVTFITGRTAEKLLSHKWPDAWYMAPLSNAMIHISARRLRRILKETAPQLSDEAVLDRATKRAKTALDAFVARRAA